MNADGDERTRYGRDNIHIGDQPVGVEDRHEQQPREAPERRNSDNLESYSHRMARAAVRVGQMPLASGTGGHVLINRRRGRLRPR